MGLDDLFDPVSLVLRQLPVHQNVERRTADPPGVPHQIAHDRQGEDRIDVGPAPDPVDAEGQGDTAVDEKIAGVVERIGADRDRPRTPDDAALIDDQQQGQGDRERHDDDADQFIGHRNRPHEPADRFDQKKTARSRDEGGLAEAGERFGLAVAEAMLTVGGLDGVVDGEEGHDGRGGVEH